MTYIVSIIFKTIDLLDIKYMSKNRHVSAMKNLRHIADQIEKEMDEKDTVRELALKSSRAIIRLASGAIRGIHCREDVSKMLFEAKEEVAKMNSVLQDHRDLYYSGFVENAFQEYCEVNILYAISKNRELPTPRQLGVTNSSYLLGLGDVVGELRRFSLDSLRHGKIDDAEKYLEMMEEIYAMLMRFDYPSGLIAVRRVQDVARSLIEKTRGEVAVSVRGKNLEKNRQSVWEAEEEIDFSSETPNNKCLGFFHPLKKRCGFGLKAGAST